MHVTSWQRFSNCVWKLGVGGWNGSGWTAAAQVQIPLKWQIPKDWMSAGHIQPSLMCWAWNSRVNLQRAQQQAFLRCCHCSLSHTAMQRMLFKKNKENCNILHIVWERRVCIVPNCVPIETLDMHLNNDKSNNNKKFVTTDASENVCLQTDAQQEARSYLSDEMLAGKHNTQHDSH